MIMNMKIRHYTRYSSETKFRSVPVRLFVTLLLISAKLQKLRIEQAESVRIAMLESALKRNGF